MRADGKRLKHFNAMYTVACHIMKDRNDACNMTTVDIPLAPLKNYVHNAHKEGRDVSHMALILSAFVRTLAAYPELNRFVVNKRVYARNEISVGMVVLMPNGEGSENKMYFQPDFTLDQVNDTINAYVTENRNMDNSNATDDIINKLLKVPGLLRMGVPVLMWMDKHGLLPKSVIKASPFHATITITNLASIKTDYIFHHVYNFGTTSMILAMGNPREVPKRRKGEIEFERCIPIGIVMDERICSGHEYAVAFRYFRKLLEDPAQLEQKPEEVKTDPAL